ncbi:NAD(FAD)-dependent dehydrogenase [Desulfitobacterium dichloroeliminans LMG P-21439]|uniref:NAD(FAD)-dependent dehydrogenase n=1 Tax=Desulfitobacterium dichloroeliminans (strain LMG P-21439 / DCA1) TaxID=871963 RepID=L0F535_DESDL|nr:FAD-dependent oxidoreductase [Desulfitobacterium dichloroeliminans]AGA67781.1 NAD(FAD)-dependent dehydrogenase [Desulfitobacterium dichloroeliminans LMG P-21439]
MSVKVLIVGGVAGGASAAARLRRLNEAMEIIIFERGEHISYANCGLPYYISGVIAERDALLVQTPGGMKDRFQIDVRTHSEVTRIFPEERVVEVQEKNGHIYRESYDELILSPGAAPVRPPIPGIDTIEAFVVRNVSDIDQIKGYIDEQQQQTAVVVGGGFIGLEMAENLSERGVQTTIIEMSNQVMAPLDFEMAAILHDHIFSKGVNLILEDGVKAFDKEENKTIITLQSGEQIQTDLTIIAIGVRPEIKLAKEAGLTIGDLGGIKVNEKLQSSDPHIYAIGDAIEVKHLITGEAALLPLAGPANKQGRIVADVISGRESRYKGTQGTSIAKIFDLVAASTGANEKILKKLGISYEISFTHSASNAGYYPGGKRLSIKLIFERNEGRVLGAQIVGSQGVDKRIDDIAGVIRREGTIYDLQELELAYAPPFSSAKDPVNMAGYVAENIIIGDVRTIQWYEVQKMNPKDVCIIDVRTEVERRGKFIVGSLHIPIDDLRNHLSELPKDKDIVLYCEIGLRGYLAYRILSQHGFTRVKNLNGGWVTYYPAVFG